MRAIRQQIMSDGAQHASPAEDREMLAGSTKVISAETDGDSGGAEDISAGTGGGK